MHVRSGACPALLGRGNLFVTVMLLEEILAVLSLKKVCEDRGCSYHCTSGQKPHLAKNGKRIDCKKSKYVPFVVPGLSTSSSTSSPLASSTSSSKDYVIRTESPAAERIGSKSAESRETRCTNQQKPKTQIKVKDAKKYKAIYRMICGTSYKEFRESLVDEGSPLEPRGNPEPGYRDTAS